MTINFAGDVTIATASFTKPSGTTAYQSGDLVANSGTAGSVVPMTLAIDNLSNRGCMIRRCRVRKSGTSVTTASFRIHFYKASPTVTNGDNSAWLSNEADDYLGSIDVTVDRAFSDGAVGMGGASYGAEIIHKSDTLYALLECRSAYTPITLEVFTIEAEIIHF